MSFLDNCRSRLGNSVFSKKSDNVTSLEQQGNYQMTNSINNPKDNPFYGVNVDDLDMIINWSAYDDYCCFSSETIRLATEEMNRQFEEHQND